MISHPWLSAYTDRCHQAFHSDVPHGPFSFVYSLTPWNRRLFHGGETLVAKPTLLRYFSEMKPGDSHEEKDLISSIPPRFNQLTVFDPRFPHGVRMVSGVESLIHSRLVIHGWFTDPRPMLEGGLTFKKVLRPMDRFAESVMKEISTLHAHSGLLCLRLSILPSGRIDSIRVLTSRLLDPLGYAIGGKELKTIIGNALVVFPKSRSKSILTLPILIQR